MQCQVGQEVFKLVVMTLQAQVGLPQYRAQQPWNDHFGQTVGNAHAQRDLWGFGGGPQHIGQLLAQLKQLLGLRVGGMACLGQAHVAAHGFEQLVAQRALQLAHLRADGLHGHAQSLCGT